MYWKFVVQVRIEAKTTNRNRSHHQSTTVKNVCLTVSDLSRLYLLGRHVMELRATLQQSGATTTTTTTLNDLLECQICCDRRETAQLPCGHQLCEECEKRWVGRNLSCPFCRQQFDRAGWRSGWNLTEFDPNTFRHDLETAKGELLAVWSQIQQKRRDIDDLPKITLIALPASLHHDVGDFSE